MARLGRRLAALAAIFPLVVAGGIVVPGDPLQGRGNVKRSLLRYGELMDGEAPSAPVDNSAFALPARAAHPEHHLEGRLEFTDSWLPPFSTELVQSGSHLIPARQGLIPSSHTRWHYVLGPGRVWSERTDRGMSRAALPFALAQVGENCIHYGVLTFLFDDRSMSRVAYQFTAETCTYNRFDLAGLVEATLTRGPVKGAKRLQRRHAAEIDGRLPTRPIEDLADVYPGIDLSAFGAGVDAQHMTAYGVFAEGVNYVSPCPTRYGDYPYCSELRMPSYSVSKTLLMGVGVLRLGQVYGEDFVHTPLAELVPESAALADWDGVTLEHTSSMATGIYKSTVPFADEGTMRLIFHVARSDALKTAAALDWPRAAPPGTRFVYKSADTYLSVKSMQQLNRDRGGRPDLFDALVRDVYRPIGLSEGALTTMRTSDNGWRGTALGYIGMYLTQDDTAKLTRLLNTDRGATTKGKQLLSPALLDQAMQRDPGARGLVAGDQRTRYRFGFWSREYYPGEVAARPDGFWVVYMSGFGGILVAMMPNGTSYYVANDNHQGIFTPAAQELLEHVPGQ